MDAAGHVIYHAAHLVARATSETATATATSSATPSSTSAASSKTERPGYYKIVGIILAVCSGLFIGCSFVIKKVGLLKANVKYNEEAGEGYGYLKNAWWWLGMTLMIIGEICNFVAYAFVDAILVTPLGALSVVITAILSSIFLKERLSFVGWVACFLCIVGSVVITLNAPEQSAVSNIQEMQHYVIAPGFLSYAGVILVGCTCVAIWVAPRYAKKSMLVYLTICSLIGGLSVVATQGLGSAIIAQINGQSQFNKWFLYVLFVFVIGTLLTEIIYLNKALNIFNAALVTPTYYVYFTSATIVTSAVLFRGFHGTSTQIIDVVMGFLTICSGVILLQLAKSSKDVPDTKVLSGDLDQIRTVAEVEEKEYEPRADTIRGGAGIVRALSTVRTRREAEEAKRIHEERMEPIGENEVVEWDGLRRRTTVSTAGGSVRRTKTIHPPLGMSHMPDSDQVSEPDSEVHPGFFGRIGRNFTQRRQRGHSPVPLDSVQADNSDAEAHVYGLPEGLRRHDDEYSDTAYKSPVASASGSQHIHWAGGERDRADSQSSSLAPPRPPPHGAGGTRRQFSFQNVTNVFSRNKSDAGSADGSRPISRGALSFASRRSSKEYPTGNNTTEEERLGLVHGDSHKVLPTYAEERESPERDSDEWQVTSGTSSSPEQIGMSTGDLGAPGRRRRDDDDYDDDLYDEPIHSPRDGSASGSGRGGRAFV
ncbi:putative magnesium transporter NIPA4 [Pseudocercospora fuligena]|uniref:Putative magnesium transporter NIPA4 n=1 Tax=Pseudocercospora fuligena TaxID=685502 RepID=A0A8H6RGJ1_9PEZI|nr:putative magnesium transporter NIPA4 [Pseudocercospora fuligena]